MQGRWRLLGEFGCLILALAVLTYGFSKLGHHELPLPAESVQARSIPTVILDAGHGGEDGGAVSASGISEKELNLAIAKQLQVLLEANGVRVVMTRKTDILLYDRNVDYQGRKKALDLAARRRIGEETPDSIFVSIHMNAYPLSEYHGLQVWYSPNNEASAPLAESIQSRVCETLQPENHRRIKSATGSIYLLHHLTSPAVLVECGFLSNPEEAERLSDPDYQKELSTVLFLAIMETVGDS